MLDYRIETFLTLCEEMNYRRTAEKLRMTQPGVTQHIRFLENHYGTKLFSYDGRTLTRTKSAELLKRHVESVRADERTLRETLAADDSRLLLRVGATKTIGEYVIVPTVRTFLADSRHDLELTVDNTEHLLLMLERAELDFAVVEGVFDKSRYGNHLYKRENFVGVCAASHPFAGRTVPLAEAFGEHIVVRERGSGTRKLLQQAISERGYSLENFSRCSSVSNFSVICDLVERDGAITFAYEPIARSRSSLATFAIEDMEIFGEFNFVYCSERSAREKIAAFLGK